MLAFNGGRSEGEWKVMAPFLASSVNVSRAKGKRSTKKEKTGAQNFQIYVFSSTKGSRDPDKGMLRPLGLKKVEKD